MTSPIQIRFQFAATLLALVFHAVNGEAQTQGEPTKNIVISENILATFVDQPCYHFEQAMNRFIANDGSASANHLRIAAAFLKLEAARATTESRPLLNKSIHDLESLAFAIEYKQLHSVDTLRQAFSAAHRAMAGHHCIIGKHRCCQECEFNDGTERIAAGKEVRAAAIHFKQAHKWTGKPLDQDTQEALGKAFEAADDAVAGRIQSTTKVSRIIDSLHNRLQLFSGRNVMIAPPPMDLGPKTSVFPMFDRP